MSKISEENYKLAKERGISRSTVFRRVKDQKWSIEAAITVPTDNLKESKRKKSLFYGAERGKLRSFRLPIELEGAWEDLVVESGLTEMDFASEIIALTINKSFSNHKQDWRSPSDK